MEPTNFYISYTHVEALDCNNILYSILVGRAMYNILHLQQIASSTLYIAVKEQRILSTDKKL